jgi:hypothetical protein
MEPSTEVLLSPASVTGLAATWTEPCCWRCLGTRRGAMRAGHAVGARDDAGA